jgi:hypothetical protein
LPTVESSPEQITISYAKQRAAQRTGALLISPFALGGMTVGIHAATQGVWPAALLFVGGGLLFGYFGGLVSFDLADPAAPRSARFDRKRRLFVVEALDGTVCELPLAEISHVTVRRHESKSKHGTTVSHIAQLKKRDGGFWDLISYSQPEEAWALVKRVEQLLESSDAPARPPGAARLPAGVTTSKVGNCTYFYWRGNHPKVLLLLHAAGITAFSSLIVGMLSGMGWNLPLTSFMVGGLALWALRAVARSHGRSFELEVSERFLTYSVKRRSGELELQRVLELQALTRLVFNFDCKRTGQQRCHQLRFLREAEVDHFQQLSAGDRGVQAALDAAKALRDESLELDLPGMRTSDVLAFEAYLEHELAQRGQPLL